MTLTTLEITPNAIALLLAGTDSENIEKTLFQCCSCNLYYTWDDLQYHQFDRECGSDLCPRCGSQDLTTNAEAHLIPINCFTFYWKDGSRQVLPGNTVEQAFSNAGFGAGAIAALDFHAPGDDNSWYYLNGSWERA